MTEDQEKQARYTKGIAVMNAGKPLATAKPEDILLRLQTESAYSVAKSLGIAHVALYQWLLRNCPDDWQALSTAVQLAKLHDAQDSLDDKEVAMDSVTVSRVRESARIAMWNMSKTSKLYADKQDNQGLSVNIVIQREDVAVTVDNDLPVQDAKPIE